MMDLLSYIEDQGVPKDVAKEFAQRKHKNQRLVSVEYQRRSISLCMPTSSTGKKFDEMVKNGQPPQANTDREFMAGTENGRQFQHLPQAGEAYKEACERRGGSVKGRKYISQLARFPGDPEAWVSGRGDVQKVCEQRGWGSEGAVSVPKRDSQTAPPKKIDIAEDILHDAVAAEIGDNIVPAKEKLDITEKVKNRLKGGR